MIHFPSHYSKRLVKAKLWSLGVVVALSAYLLAMFVWSTWVKFAELNEGTATYQTSGWRQIERFEPSNGVAYLLMGVAFVALFILSWRFPPDETQ